MFGFLFRSHDGFSTLPDGTMEAESGSTYASQRIVFNDLGQGVLDNAFEGKIKCLNRLCMQLS